MRSFKRWSKITHIDPVACSLGMNKHSGICQIIQKLNILPAIWLWFNHCFFGNVVDRNYRMSSLKTISNGQDMWENVFKLRILNEICFEFLLNSSPHQQKRKSVENKCQKFEHPKLPTNVSVFSFQYIYQQSLEFLKHIFSKYLLYFSYFKSVIYCQMYFSRIVIHTFILLIANLIGPKLARRQALTPGCHIFRAFASLLKPYLCCS